ncbi:MAG: hypothetical protein U0529_18190 [Thermoanaerobaculia bacterium]
MTRRLWFCLRTSLLVLPLLSPPAAAISREVPLDEVFTRGEAVFVGKVASTRTVWGEGKKMIWTEYAFEVRETWKGEAGTSRVVRVAGGTLDGKAIVLSHVPVFEVGGTYVVSAYGNDHLYASPVVGTEQGMFREVVDEASGEALLVDVSGRRLERDGTGRLRRGRPSEPGSQAGLVRLVPDAELARRVARSAPPSLAPLVYRDAAGNVVEKGRARVAPPRNATPLRLDGATVTVPALKEHVAGLLKAEAR